MEKILGVIGGMGPGATIQFYKNITDKTLAKTDQEHIRMIILNHTTIPDRTEYILGGKGEEILSLLMEDAKYLEEGKVSAIAIPCNTSHYFVEELEKKIKTPIINMIKETAKVAQQTYGKGKVGILATDGTIQMELYQKALKDENMTPYIIGERSQQIIMNIIYTDIKAGNKGNKEEFAKVEQELKDAGCICALLACTELSIYRVEANLGKFYIDAMDILENKVIEVIKGK